MLTQRHQTVILDSTKLGPVDVKISWGSGKNGDRIRQAIDTLTAKMPASRSASEYILDLLDREDLDAPSPLALILSSKDWRVLRFCLARARESI